MVDMSLLKVLDGFRGLDKLDHRERHGRVTARRTTKGQLPRTLVEYSSRLKRSWGDASRQDIRHSDERTRQWSTARRRVSMVEDMGSTLGEPDPRTLHSISHRG
ncbi:hypothetical protein GCM10027600_34740 [Nocardioides ginsengisegetis]